MDRQKSCHRQPLGTEPAFAMLPAPAEDNVCVQAVPPGNNRYRSPRRDDFLQDLPFKIETVTPPGSLGELPPPFGLGPPGPALAGITKHR